MIHSYSFGHMKIDGRFYPKDLIILPDGTIISPWWRKRGHKLEISDIRDILATSPEILVIGTGDPGRMKPNGTLSRELKAMGIEARVMPTQEAVKEFNTLLEQHVKVAGCFHLTC